MKKILLTALASSALTLCIVYLGIVYLAAAPAEVTRKVVLNDTKYERIDSKTGEKIERARKGGDVIWHFKGESAPKLVNIDDKPFRSLIIALQQSPERK